MKVLLNLSSKDSARVILSKCVTWVASKATVQEKIRCPGKAFFFGFSMFGESYGCYVFNIFDMRLLGYLTMKGSFKQWLSGLQ